jgi:hypothetical protein
MAKKIEVKKGKTAPKSTPKKAEVQKKAVPKVKRGAIKKAAAKKSAPAKKATPSKKEVNSKVARGPVAKKAAKTKTTIASPPKRVSRVTRPEKKAVQKPSLPAAKEKVQAPKKEKKVKAAPSVIGYTTDQLEKFKDIKESLKLKNNQELKDLLRKNDQSMSGNKDDLIEKVADGMVLGKIPRCSSCFGGRLRFDYKRGVYNCPGYRDDADYHNCHKVFTLKEVTRDPWTS